MKSKASAMGRLLRAKAAPMRPRRGFQRFEFGLEWHRSLDELYASYGAGQVPKHSALVAATYEYESKSVSLVEQPLWREGHRSLVGQARKFSSFDSHEELWDQIQECQKKAQLHTFDEVLEESRPRCLYFDLDGDPAYNSHDDLIQDILRRYVRWFFGGDELGWDVQDPEPVALTSMRPTKYSSHVLFPQIQFKNYAHQCRYLPCLLRCAAAEVHAELEGEGEPHYILKNLVDRAPYKKLQLLRAPRACKLQGGLLDPETCMEPQEPFAGDELTFFASYVHEDYALELPTMQQLMDNNPSIAKHYHCWAREGRQRDDLLFSLDFHRPAIPDSLDLAALTDLERYEQCMPLLHPDRASDWSSWFRISGITATMLHKYEHDREACDRIWDAHCRWSSTYPHFDERENWDIVWQAMDRRTAGLRLLLELVRHDNPDLKVRELAWSFRLPRKGQARAVL